MERFCVAKIALAAATYAIDKPYSYRVPEETASFLRKGMRVLVPFGAGNRRVEGIVLALDQEEDRSSPQKRKLKSILAVLDEEPVLEEEHIKLALWMRERFFCTVYEAARAIMRRRGALTRPSGYWN